MEERFASLETEIVVLRLCLDQVMQRLRALEFPSINGPAYKGQRRDAKRAKHQQKVDKSMLLSTKPLPPCEESTAP